MVMRDILLLKNFLSANLMRIIIGKIRHNPNMIVFDLLTLTRTKNIPRMINEITTILNTLFFKIWNHIESRMISMMMPPMTVFRNAVR